MGVWHLSVRLLEAGTGTLTTELLGLAAAVVGNEEGTVELDEGLLEHVLGVLIDELLVVGDQGLGDGLADGVDLRGVTTTGDADADVDVGELVKTDNKDGLVDLQANNVRMMWLSGGIACVLWVWPSQRVQVKTSTCDMLTLLPFETASSPSLRTIALVSDSEIGRTLKRRISGWTSWRGRPLTLMRPWPAYRRKHSQYL